MKLLLYVVNARAKGPDGANIKRLEKKKIAFLLLRSILEILTRTDIYRIILEIKHLGINLNLRFSRSDNVLAIWKARLPEIKKICPKKK